jgi:hypothetical protein
VASATIREQYDAAPGHLLADAIQASLPTVVHRALNDGVTMFAGSGPRQDDTRRSLSTPTEPRRHDGTHSVDGYWSKEDA